MRAGTLLLGGVQLLGGTPSGDTALALTAFAVVVTTVAVFGRAALRIRCRSALPPLDGPAVLAETVAGVAGLLLLRGATPVDALVGPEFWMLPFTVVTAVLLAAACRRVVVGLAGSLVLAAGYLVAISPALHHGPTTGPGAPAAALDNALSYAGFYAFGLIVVRLQRFVAGEAELLRRIALAATTSRVTRTMLAVATGVSLRRYSERLLAAALSTPTLLVQGGDDTVVPPPQPTGSAAPRWPEAPGEPG
ncbi:MAG: hypothetical protein ACR2LJ_08875 [Acidimicrobiales bacterium]